MKSEIEAKFLEIDIERMQNMLRSIGADCVVPMRLMRRVMIDYEDRRLQTGPDAFVRVRDEGHKVTLTYKQFDSLSVDGAKEIEVVVSDFDETIKIFEAVGLCVKSYQESRRETWTLGDVEIVIDEWPWLKPYIEIEADSESAIRDIASRLQLAFENAVFGDVMAAYRAEYPHLTLKDTVGNLKEVKFDTDLPDLFRE
jgi:adenylate cyclase class 2